MEDGGADYEGEEDRGSKKGDFFFFVFVFFNEHGCPVS
jgi:hypothetical protein